MQTIDTKTSVNTYLKNLIHYIHQNFLVATKFLHSRIINKVAPNLWISMIKETFDKKLSLPIRNKQQAN